MHAVFSSRLSLYGFAQGFASLLLSLFQPAPLSLKPTLAVLSVTGRAAHLRKSRRKQLLFRQRPIPDTRLLICARQLRHRGKSSSGTLEQSLLFSGRSFASKQR